jgi:hypothetical protein
LIWARIRASGASPPTAEVSSSGACARSADRPAAASSAGGPGFATTTTGAEANKLRAMSAATTSPAPVSTDVVTAGGRVRAASGTWSFTCW